MTRIYLERYDPDKNLHRYYQLHVVPGIFGDWSLIKEWGKVGFPGTLQKEWFETEDEALQAGERIRTIKEKKGYTSILAAR